MTNPIKTTITDEQLEQLRAQVGVVNSSAKKELADSEIKRSTVRTWAVLNADMRPLYMDPDHAQASPWGAIIAPPAIILSYERINPGVDFLPGAYPILSKAQLNFDKPIRVGDTVVSESEITQVEEVTNTGVAGRVISAAIETRVKDADGQPVGTAVQDWHLYERGSDAQRTLFAGRGDDAHMHSQEDIEALGAEYKTEEQRGADSLYWDDVSEGDELQHLLKGPTTRIRAGDRRNSTWYWGHKQGWDEMDDRPELFFTNENGMLEPVMATDWVHHRAQRWGGLPGALENAADRPNYLVQALANWMGDSGFPAEVNLDFPIQSMIGDVTRSYGRVTGKSMSGDQGLVTLEVWQINQLDQKITTGTATVVLPTR